ncbi:hypothetical protein C8A03DRAFT_34438 [Achaetomium macrosporum]|uniref:Uncharacterized protein n=1 Tax=Achaetomium macrosporum TaxID=79813 RepID=A0AAN7H6N0_9PEZI|nr:hypothetical protein C8A03DRAFT_34438 [Achaetomium macrosporum]
MAVKDNAADQADDGSLAEVTAPFLPDSVSQLSPNSEITSTTMTSPTSSSTSPLPFVTLADQTFTPLSIDTSDSDLSNINKNNAAGERKSPGVQEAERLLSRAKSIEHLRRDGNLSRSSSSSTTAAAASVAGRGATLVSARVESFEALQAKTATANLGYELLRTKSQGQRPAGLVSPPSTRSRSPSPSPVGRAPAENEQSTTDAGLGAAEQETAVAARKENTTAPQTTAPTQNPDPPASIANASQAHDAPELPLPASSAPDSAPTTVSADTTLIRPVPSASQPQARSRADSNPIRPRTSSTASLTLSHPRPDPNRLSQAGGFLGNIAALEATAERLSMTSSIEDAIREEHNELKRSESRRSSVLQNRARAASTSHQSQLSVASRQNSVLENNNAARTGGYSPGGFVMSPNRSTSAASGRLRSGSKASSIGMPSYILGNADTVGPTGDADHAQEFRFLPRHGPGKASTRSVASKLSIVQIAELEHPSSLTKEVLDEADRAAAAGKPLDDEDDTIRASAYQFIEAEFADDVGPSQPMLGAAESHAEPAPRLQLHQPVDYRYQPYQAARRDDDRPTTSGSGTTFEQAQAAFGDFDGVHCDPEADRFGPHPEPEDHGSPARPHAAQAPPATSYIDPATGQQMLYYPAPVPAMLNLPPKLSKKPKAAAQNTRRSLVAGARPRVSRESNVWLPDPTEGLRRTHDDAPFMSEFLGSENGSGSHTASQPSGMEGETQMQPSHARHTSEATVRTIQPPAEAQRETRRPQRLAEAGNRKSHAINADGMPPQLRASAFFDLPPEVPKIEVKDGSAMDTLDSLLEASTKAPVNAFTDHVFAGKLGAEVYGTGKKKKIKKSATAPDAAPEEKAAKRKTLVKRNSSGNLLGDNAEEKPKRKTLVKRNSSANLLDPNTEKKRASRFSLFGSKHADKNDSDNDDDARSARHSAADDDARSRRSPSPDRQAPDADEETEESSEEEEPVYQGPPTTLLAELQLRKQQNKMRTRPVQQAYPDGMRSTLLELEAVAEVERKARLGKRVTLAWEDPAAAAHQESDDDEEVPLGVLYAAKAAGAGNRSTMDISAIMSEVHRPLGLMERREMEENEPLSRRRDRLQGKVTEQLPTPLTALQKRLSHMPTTNRLTLPVQPGGRSRPGSAAGDNNQNGEESEPEHEGETLAARKARLAAENPLPRARPVSATFSSELLSVLGVDDNDDSKSKGKTPAHSRNVSTTSALGNKENAPPVPEEKETLGQRRARLQREREAREREMAFSTLNRAATPLGLSAPNNMKLNQTPNMNMSRASLLRPGPAPMPMADVLGASRPMTTMSMVMDPREQERLRREAEAARHRRETDAKMAALRAQMPTSLSSPSVGAPTGGYMGGRFNDGLGGNGVTSGLGYCGPQRGGSLLGVPGVTATQGLLGGGGYGGSTPNLLLPGVYPHGGLAASMSVSALPLQGNNTLGGGGGAGQAGHMDMVERWRQGVMP